MFWRLFQNAYTKTENLSKTRWSLIYLQFYKYFLWILAIELNSLAVLSKRAHRFEGKLNICRDQQYVLNLAAFMSILEKTTTVLKFVVDSINLGLRDSHYFFFDNP